MNSIFWKLLAVAAVASVFYLGHGLHERHGVALGDFESNASAADEPIAKPTPNWESLSRGQTIPPANMQFQEVGLSH